MSDIKKGSTDVTVYFKLVDDTTGSAKSGLTVTAIDGTYVRTRRQAVKNDLTAAASADSAHSDNTCFEVDATNAPGLYRVDFPDAAFANSSDVGQVILIATHASCEPSMHLYDMVVNVAGELAADSITASVIAADAITAAKFAVNAINASAIAADAIDASAIAASAITAAKFAAGAIDANAIASDAIDASAIAANAITAAKIADGAIDNATFASGAIGSTALAADVVTDIFSGNTIAEAYAADGAAATPAQLLYMIWAFLAEKAIVSTTLTANQLDGSTAAMTFSLSDATSPTSITRAT